MKFHYQILTTPTADTPGTTVLLHFPDKRYFFGQLSEGTQRACTESGTKLSYVTDIFLTGRMEWGNTGGLIGVILTQADGLASSANAIETAAREKEVNRQKYSGRQPSSEQNVSEKKKEHGMAYAAQDGQLVTQRGTLTIHGARNLAHTLATARRFVFRKGMPVFTREYDSESMSKKLRMAMGSDDAFEQPTWTDSNIKVWAMPITPSSVPQTTRPQSPRKRSLDEFQEKAPTPGELDPRAQDQIMRQSVVADMFNSSWTLDALVETRLAEVKMPAVMFVRDPETKDLVRYTGPAPGSDEPLPEITVLVRKPWPGASIEKIPMTTRCNEALSYIIRNHDIRGKFDPMKARQLNVKPGEDYGVLARGKNVISRDGKVVTPEMVLGPPRLGKGLAIVDLPTPEYVENLVSRPEWKSPSVTTNLEAILWILGPGVGDHPQLRKFVDMMPHCKHVVSSADYCPNYLSMKSIAGSSIRMAQLRPENFPVPVHDNLTTPQKQPYSMPPFAPSVGETDKSPFEPAEPGLIIDMEPKFQLNRTDVVPRLNTASLLKQMPLTAQRRASIISSRLKKTTAQRNLKQFLKDLPGADVEIIALGTGSSSPSKYRNVSSTLLSVPGQGYYLLDCGENTLGQLKRVFEPEKLREVFQNLRLIWISHLHADHHLGTASVIKAWYQINYPNGVPESDVVETDMSNILQDKRLFLVSEEMMVEWLEEYAGVEDFGFGKLTPLTAIQNVEGDSIKTRLIYRHCRADGSYPGRESESGQPATTELSFTDTDSPLTPLLQSATGLSDLLTTKVSHCRGAMAVSLVFPDGFKASFSGDCRPSPTFAAIGKGSTVLIHEATFQDDMVGSAIAKKHSTTSEAIDVGRKMRARSIFLTHFSQRYQKVAHIDQPQDNAAASTTTSPRHSVQKRRGEAAAPSSTSQPTLTDIPADELEEGTDIPMAIDLDLQDETPPAIVPIVTAFDYMRVRVGDMFTLEAYTPAVEKLYQMLERAAEQETEKLKLEREAADHALGKKDKKQQRSEKYIQGATPGATVFSKNKMDISVTPPKPPKHISVWSASESESGWTNSESESDHHDSPVGSSRRSRSRGGSRSRSRSPRRYN